MGKEATRLMKEAKAFVANKRKRDKQANNSEWYSLRSLLGNDWAMFYFLIGGREAGKSYATTNFFISQWKRYNRPWTWLRLTEASQKKLLQNNAEKLIDPDIRRNWNLDIVTSGTNVYEVTKRDQKGKILEKKLMARVLALNTFYNDKGNGLFDKDFLNDPNMYYNICLDEMNREESEKNTFDITYAFANQIENLIRSTKRRVRIICIGNTLQEASDIMAPFNFFPQEFGRYYLKKKRAIIDYIPPTEQYKERREGTAADILAGDSSTFTNQIQLDKSLVSKKRLRKPQVVIRFTKATDGWFVVWDSGIIARFNGETTNRVIAMRPYLNCRFDQELRDLVFKQFNAQSYLFRDLTTQILFQKHLMLLKPRS